MKFLYNFIMTISEKILFLFGNFFSPKIKAFSAGRKKVWESLDGFFKKDTKNIWFHVSSLGEYEQALPLIEKIKVLHPSYSIVLSFFSPSGYEIKKDKTPADKVVYLPIDTHKNAKKFLDLVRPSAAFFIKYDFWPNYLNELHQRKIPTYLISGRFRKNHSFFRPWNKWLKNALKAFKLFFVQDETSKEVLKEEGFQNVIVTGDTRFDRVFDIAEKSEKPEFVRKFKAGKKLFIAGSTWPKDEDLIFRYLTKHPLDFKILLAPHEVDQVHIEKLKNQFKDFKILLYSEINFHTSFEEFDILILDTIGLLNKTYYFADWVYIGNGFGKSIHNIQEPAVYGIPIITGPNIEKFNEAIDLERLGGLIKINTQAEFNKAMELLKTDKNIRQEKGEIVKNYALANKGATDKIISLLDL